MKTSEYAAAAQRQACLEATLEVLDAMFFEMPEDDPPGDAPPPPPSLHAAAVFSGSSQGQFQACVEPLVLRRLAASFLGREDERTVTLEEKQLVLCELTNMLCGNTLSRLAPEGRFRIEQPRITGDSGDGSAPWISVLLESGTLAVRLEMPETP